MHAENASNAFEANKIVLHRVVTEDLIVQIVAREGWLLVRATIPPMPAPYGQCHFHKCRGVMPTLTLIRTTLLSVSTSVM